jgi:acyl phosphate:glycerol-3-phosphate acyltransferase
VLIMADIALSALAVLAGYLLGSFPAAALAARLVKGKDISAIGEGNMGALNTARGVGFIPGLLVFLADTLKGAGAVMLAERLGVSRIVVFTAGFAAVVGHTWPVFHRFRGGRGGATGYGVLAGLAPLPGVIAFGVMLLTMILTSNARLSLFAGFASMPLLFWAFGLDLTVIIYAVALPLILGVRMLAVDWRKLKDPATKKNLIIDRNYTWWQKKRR